MLKSFAGKHEPQSIKGGALPWGTTALPVTGSCKNYCNQLMLATI